jgi:hypothetical protein
MKFSPLTLIALAVAATAAAAVPTTAQAPGLAMLGQLERGQWQIRDREAAGAAGRAICLGDARTLLQLRHPGATCSRFVVEDAADVVTVQYSCPGSGNGRTTIRRETNRLVQVETQGILNGAPFAAEYEVRRVGVCG